MPQDKNPRRLASDFMNCEYFDLGVIGYGLWVCKFPLILPLQFYSKKVHLGY
jgi:hypothetical protein